MWSAAANPKVCYLKTPLPCNSRNSMSPSSCVCSPTPCAWTAVTMWGLLSSSLSAHKAPWGKCPKSTWMSMSAVLLIGASVPSHPISGTRWSAGFSAEARTSLLSSGPYWTTRSPEHCAHTQNCIVSGLTSGLNFQSILGGIIYLSGASVSSSGKR